MVGGPESSHETVAEGWDSADPRGVPRSLVVASAWWPGTPKSCVPHNDVALRDPASDIVRCHFSCAVSAEAVTKSPPFSTRRGRGRVSLHISMGD